jgi:hypothetical protein
MYTYVSGRSIFGGTSVLLLTSLHHHIDASKGGFMEVIWGELLRLPVAKDSAPIVQATTRQLSKDYPQRLFSLARYPLTGGGMKIFYGGRVMDENCYTRIATDPGRGEDLKAVSRQLMDGQSDHEKVTAAAFKYWVTDKKHFLPEELAKRVGRVWF